MKQSACCKAHHSSRSYKTDPIPEDILEAIVESARRAPTSTNSHEISLVVVRNADSRARIAENCRWPAMDCAGAGVHRGRRRSL